MTELRKRIERLEARTVRQTSFVVREGEQPSGSGRYFIRAPRPSATAADWMERCRRGEFGVLSGLHVGVVNDSP